VREKAPGQLARPASDRKAAPLVLIEKCECRTGLRLIRHAEMQPCDYCRPRINIGRKQVLLLDKNIDESAFTCLHLTHKSDTTYVVLKLMNEDFDRLSRFCV